MSRMSNKDKHPATEAPFLDVRVRDVASDPSLRALCVGYENGVWREEAFAKHVIEWLPEFSLDYTERQAIGDHNCVKLTAKAALSVYSSDKYQKRGEFGEIFLHMALRQDCGTIPAISKIYFKSATNDTVKGFDAVHIVNNRDEFELWLGEVKFYEDIGQAIRDVCAELTAHTKRDYLRDEFLWIGNKLDPGVPGASKIARLLDRNSSLDATFQRLCFPVLLTYDSACVASHRKVGAAYIRAFKSEVQRHYDSLVARGLPPRIRIHVILLPLLAKKALVAELDRRLKLWQEM